MTLHEHLSAAFDEVRKMQAILQKRVDEPGGKPLGPKVMAIGTVFGNYGITTEGSEHLWQASSLLLKKEKLDTKISVSTARECLNAAGADEIKRRLSFKKISIDAIINRASKNLHAQPTKSGTYIYPAIISGQAFTTELEYGPVRLVSRNIFESEFHKLLDTPRNSNEEDTGFSSHLVEVWKDYTEHYSYFVLVQVSGHEYKMAEVVGREAAEWLLNLIRLRVGWRDGSRIRIAGERRPERRSAFVMVDEDGLIHGATNVRWEGAIFEEGWANIISDELQPLGQMLSGIAARFVRGDARGDPIFERLQYANHLFTEAFSEPSNRLKLVKIIAAFESLAVLPREAKADTLAERCGLAISFFDPACMEDAKVAVRQAYSARNAVIHGDAPEEVQANMALYKLEPYLQVLVISLMRILVIVRNANQPKSIRLLRRQIGKEYERIEEDYQRYLLAKAGD